MRYYIFITFSLISILVCGQKNKKLTRAEYIEVYKSMAMEEMERTGIPASITLAQGILESGDGNSTLAVKANNHFGIKCHDWDGPSVRHDDDSKNECFRKYKNSEQSYKDHSDFLTGRKRYADLFELDPDDYKNWAKGLKKAGYATSPTYSKALIGIIEDNQLYVYDKEVLASKGKGRKTSKTDLGNLLAGRSVMYNNRVKYIVADSGDTYVSLAEELSLFGGQLPRYNDAYPADVIEAGDYVYLQPKRSRTYGKHKTHMVAIGEDLHFISQQYAIKESKLRKNNNIPEGSEPAPGVVLVLRGKLKTDKAPATIKSKEKEDKDIQLEKDPVETPEFEIEYDLGG